MFFLLASTVFAQTSPFPNPDIIIQDDVNLRSINIVNVKKGIILPYAKLGERFEISFDDLDSDIKNYYYKVEHCESNWEVSDIFDNDFLEGYNEAEITKYKYSFNTLKKYTHYSFTFPNNRMRVLVSGNYLLKVYLDDPDEPAFVRRLVIYEDIVTIGAKARRATVVNKMDTDQQINFTLNHKDLTIDNPSTEISVNILQNNTWNNAIYNLKYQYVGNKTLIYNYNDKSNFKGGNFFFHFDTKSIRTAGLYTDYINLKDIYNHYLYTSYPRYNLPFTIQQDFNGGFVLRTIDGGDIENEGDYTNVHFHLDPNIEYPDYDFYVYGAFNDWRLEEENRLKFNKSKNIFETEILLKQGYFDYKFVAYNNKKDVFMPNKLSGSFYQTENNYSIIVYYRDMNSRFDRVVGFLQIRAQDIF